MDIRMADPDWSSPSQKSHGKPAPRFMMCIVTLRHVYSDPVVVAVGAGIGIRVVGRCHSRTVEQARWESLDGHPSCPSRAATLV